VKIVDRAAFTEADVVLCGLNDTRRRTNWNMRAELGFARLSDRRSPPWPDEIPVCLKNDYSVFESVYNGSLWNVEQTNIVRGGFVRMALDSAEGMGNTEVVVPIECFTPEPPPSDEVSPYQLFDFGYCVTTHKAQGSEWGRVCLINEANAFKNTNGEHAQRWLYTGITRAIDELVIVDYS
jgi:exodeoxyribonuclease V